MVLCMKNIRFFFIKNFAKFLEALNETIEHVKGDLMPDFDFSQFDKTDGEEVAIEGNLEENLELEEEEEVGTRLRWD